MAFPLYGSAFTDDVTAISQAFLHFVRASMAAMIDGALGSKHSPTQPIEIGGSGIKIANDTRIAYNTRAVSRKQSMRAFDFGGDWVVRPGLVWRNSGGALNPFWISLNKLPDRGTLTSVTVRYRGAGTHAPFPGGAPTMPSFELWRIDGDGVATSLGTATDTSSTAAIYEADHPITLSGLSEAITKASYRYAIEFASESGGNFIANGEVKGVTCLCAVTEQPEF